VLLQTGQQVSPFVAMAIVATFTSLLWRYRQEFGSECWSVSVSLRDFIGTWKLQIDRPQDRFVCVTVIFVVFIFAYVRAALKL